MTNSQKPSRTEFSAKNTYFQTTDSKQNGVFSGKHIFSNNRFQTERSFQPKTHIFKQQIPNRTEFSVKNTFFQTTDSKQNGVFSQKHIFQTTDSKQNGVFSQKHIISNNRFQTERSFQSTTHFFKQQIPNRTEFSAKNTYFQPQISKQNGVFSGKHIFSTKDFQTERSFQPKTIHFQTTDSKQNGVFSQKHIFSNNRFQTERSFQSKTHIFKQQIPNRTEFSAKNTYFQTADSKQNGVFSQKHISSTKDFPSTEQFLTSSEQSRIYRTVPD